MLDSKSEITDEEYDKYLVPSNDNLKDYMKKYIIPEVFAFKVANNYYRGCLCDGTFMQHFNTACDMFNVLCTMEEIGNKALELLKIKYNLIITEDAPMKIERWQ